MTTISSIATYHEHFNALCLDYIDKYQAPSQLLTQAMAYALSSGGKRFRPMLVYAAGEILNVPRVVLDRIALSIECVHTYSLVHDDLPAMDDDDYRRGKPSCHKQYDEATAILVGDALQSMAFEILCEPLAEYLDTNKTLSLIKTLSIAIGAKGMVAGQQLDMTVLQQPDVSEATLTTVHKLKTGRLIQACIDMPVIASQHNHPFVQELTNIGLTLGVLFQMQDDYLDRYHSDKHGKLRASDCDNEKTTFCDIYSQDALLKKIHDDYEIIERTLTQIGSRSRLLHTLLTNLKQTVSFDTFAVNHNNQR